MWHHITSLHARIFMPNVFLRSSSHLFSLPHLWYRTLARHELGMWRISNMLQNLCVLLAEVQFDRFFCFQILFNGTYEKTRFIEENFSQHSEVPRICSGYCRDVSVCASWSDLKAVFGTIFSVYGDVCVCMCVWVCECVSALSLCVCALWL